MINGNIIYFSKRRANIILGATIMYFKNTQSCHKTTIIFFLRLSLNFPPSRYNFNSRFPYATKYKLRNYYDGNLLLNWQGMATL